MIFFNYKDGERCVDFSVLSDSENTEGAISSNEKKTNTHENECSPLIKSGDPYGNRIEKCGAKLILRYNILHA